jgi:hypothetical protein
MPTRARRDGHRFVVEFASGRFLRSVDSSITEVSRIQPPKARTTPSMASIFREGKHFSATGTGTYDIHIVNTTAVTSPLIIANFVCVTKRCE